MKTGKSLIQLATEIERQRETRVDYIAPSKKLDIIPVEKDGKVDVRLHIPTPVEDVLVPLNPLAHRQLGEYLNIPAKYYDRMREDAPDLLAVNARHWLHKTDDKRMLRLLDSRCRALLSDAFRPLENSDLAEAALPVLMEMGVEIISAEITERRLYIKAVDARVNRDIPTGHRMGDGSHTIFDTCCPILTISNSEVGAGQLSVETGVFTKGCTNLAIFKQHSMKRRHVGKRHDLITDEMANLLSADTRALTDKATWAQVADVVRGAFDEARFAARCDEIAGMATQVIESDDVVKVVHVAAQMLGVTEDEKKSVLKHLIQGGDLTRYGLFNAITRTAEDLGDYDRATDFERMGGEVIELAANDWKRIATAA